MMMMMMKCCLGNVDQFGHCSDSVLEKLWAHYHGGHPTGHLIEPMNRGQHVGCQMLQFGFVPGLSQQFFVLFKKENDITV